MITINELTKQYGPHTAVDALSFSVRPGIVTGFLGPNGAGKSTTMRMILGLDAPTSGTATVNGRALSTHAAPLTELGALLARTTRADVVLMDIRMPGTDGLEATRVITSEDDLAGVRVLVLTTFELDEYVIEAIRAGASGFLGKGAEPSELLDAIRVIAAGDALLSPQATQTLIARFTAQPDAGLPTSAAALEVLTPREREIVALVATGLSNDEIAERLVVSTLTATTHVNRAMMKLGAHDRAQLVVIAFQTGLVRAGGS